MKKSSLVKKLLGCGLALTFAVGLAGCGSKSDEDKTLLDAIKEKGTITVGTKPDYAPYEFYIMENGQKKLVGFDIEIAKEIAKEIGVDVKFEEMDFELIPEAVKSGKVDIGISGLTPKPDRKKVVDFSINYYNTEQGILVPAGSSINTKEDLKGKKIGAQTGSIQYDMAMSIEDAQVTALGDVNNLVLDLKNGKYDAVLVELPVANTIVSTNKELKVCDEVLTYEAEGNAVAVPKEQEELLNLINDTLQKLIDEGKIEQFVKDAEALSSQDITGQE